MSLESILLCLFFLIFICAIPSWDYSRAWGLLPCVGIAFFLLLLVVAQLSRKL